MARLTYGHLLALAKSGDPNDRKRGFELFQAWVKAAPRMTFADRLTQMERSVLEQIFAQKGFKVARK